MGGVRLQSLGASQVKLAPPPFKLTDFFFREVLGVQTMGQWVWDSPVPTQCSLRASLAFVWHICGRCALARFMFHGSGQVHSVMCPP